MFTDFQDVWTPVALSRHLRQKPLPLQIAGEPVVLFRDAAGKPGALHDRCPHRGVALSLGRRTAQGHLACAFHGWEFQVDGACVRVPLNPHAKCAQLHATPFPVHEAGGLVWMYTGEAPATAVPPPHVPESLTHPAFTRYTLEVVWQTHWTRAMENMLDSPHLPFVHQRTIGRGLRRALRPDSRMEVTYTPTDQGALLSGVMDGKHDAGVLEFNKPNGMVLHVTPPMGQIRLHVFCIPVHATRTRLLVVSARNFGRYNPLAHLFDQVNRMIVLEDRAVVESSWPPEVPPLGAERSVATDRATLQFRKYYHDTLKTTDPVAPPGRGGLRLAQPPGPRSPS